LLEPTVTLYVAGGSLEFSLSYIVDYTKRTVVKDRLFTKIVDEVANSKGKLEWAASPLALHSATDIHEPANLGSALTGAAR
jgi:hypothetical protein